MPNNTPDNSALGPYRVLDLTEGGVNWCGKLLADLGADVIKVEPPGGSPTRMRGPFYRGQRHPERSLFWFAYCVNKRGVTLDLESEEGRRAFVRLADTADVVLESFAPGHMDSLGLGYDALRERNPGLIYTSVTPFGPTGPHAHYKATDIVVWSMGGMQYASGGRRPPARPHHIPTGRVPRGRTGRRRDLDRTVASAEQRRARPARGRFQPDRHHVDADEHLHTPHAPQGQHGARRSLPTPPPRGRPAAQAPRRARVQRRLRHHDDQRRPSRQIVHDPAHQLDGRGGRVPRVYGGAGLAHLGDGRAYGTRRRGRERSGSGLQRARRLHSHEDQGRAIRPRPQTPIPARALQHPQGHLRGPPA